MSVHDDGTVVIIEYTKERRQNFARDRLIVNDWHDIIYFPVFDFM